AGRVGGPAHGGGLAGRLVEGDPVGGRPGAGGAVAVAVGGVGAAAVGLGDDGGRVVVDAEEVRRLVDLAEVAVAHEGPVGQPGGVLEQVLRVGALEHRAGEHPVGEG